MSSVLFGSSQLDAVICPLCPVVHVVQPCNKGRTKYGVSFLPAIGKRYKSVDRSLLRQDTRTVQGILQQNEERSHEMVRLHHAWYALLLGRGLQTILDVLIRAQTVLYDVQLLPARLTHYTQ